MKRGYGPILITRRCPPDKKMMGVSVLGLIKSLFPWDKTFRQNFEKGEILLSVDTHCTPLCFAQSINCMPP